MSNDDLGDVAGTIARSRTPLQDTIKSLIMLRDTVDARIREIRELDEKLAEVEEKARGLLGGLGGIGGTLTTAGVTTSVTTSSEQIGRESRVQVEPPKPEQDSNAFDTNTSAGNVSVRDAILTTLNSEDRPFTTKEIHERVVAYGATAKNSMTTRSIISKLHNANLIRQVSRGVYQALDGASDVARETMQSRLYLLNDEPSLADPPVDQPDHDTRVAPRSE